jgi:hypothetical protein
LLFKLFITVLVLSDSGAVSQNAIVTDYDNPAACIQMAKEINGTADVSYGTRSARIFSKAICDTRQATESGPVKGGIPPPVAQMFNGFNRLIQQQQGR